MLRKLRLRQKNDFPLKKSCISITELHSFFIRTRKIDSRLIVLIFRRRPRLKMFLFCSYLKFSHISHFLLTVHPTSKIFCKLFSFLYLLPICAKCKEIITLYYLIAITLHYYNYRVIS